MKTVSLYFSVVMCALFSAGAVNAQTNYLPSFSFYDLEGKVFTQEKVRTDLSTMIMLFDPYCDHCAHQADWIAEAEKEFENVQLIFVTIEPETEVVKQFKEEHFGKTKLKYLYFLQDKDFSFETYFGYTDDAINIYLYKPGQRRPKYFGEEQEVLSLLKFL
ncbi:MAG: SCO family protein [Bacteroidia bacterium]